MKASTANRSPLLSAFDALIILAAASQCFSRQVHQADARITAAAHRRTRCAFITSPSALPCDAINYNHPKLFSVRSSTDSPAGNSSEKVVRKKRGKSQKNLHVKVDTTPPIAPTDETFSTESDEDLDELFAALSAQKAPKGDDVKLVDFIEQNIGIQTKQPPSSKKSTATDTTIDTSSQSTSDEETSMSDHANMIMEEQPPPSVTEKKGAPYNVVCTHITADFDTLASAIGLAKLWSLGIYTDDDVRNDKTALPTYVVLPRGAHPDVSRFLSLHKHLFPIRSLKSLPGLMDDTSEDDEGLQRVGLVDAQRRDRLGPADILLEKASMGVTIVDHHVDAESDIDSQHYIVENVGSVSTMIAERLKRKGVRLTEAEATVLALGIHGDTGSLVYDSTVRYHVC
jgi:hypothetical protein